MKVLDLFSGLGGWSQAFKDRYHQVTTIDIEERFNPTWCMDLLDELPEEITKPNIILASPPCETFSQLTVMKHWTKEGQPKTSSAKIAISLVKRTLEIIDELKPDFWIIENPRARLRTLDIWNGREIERRTITWCSFGHSWMKPTDLWGKFPPNLILPNPCISGMSCHQYAPRGSATGTQGGNSSSGERAKLPYGLSLFVCVAMEREMWYIEPQSRVNKLRNLETKMRQ